MESLFKRNSGRTLQVLALVGAMISGCQDDEDAIGDQVRQIAFEIAVLGEDQREGTVFEPGTDVSFALKLINHSAKPFEWRYEYDCDLYQSANFLQVYKRNEGETSSDWIPLGTPYPGPVYCLMINMPPWDLPAGETMLGKVPWSSNPDNRPLSVGKYYVTAQVELNVDGQLRTWNLRADFEM